MALAGDDVHDCVGRVARIGEMEAEVFKVGLDVLFGPLVDDAALAEEDQRIEGFEDLGARLVDDGDDGDVEAREFFERHHDGRGRGGVEPAGGFVEEERHGCGGELDADTHAFPLPAGDDGCCRAADEAIFDVGELEAGNQDVDVSLDLPVVPAGRKADARRVQDVFAHGQLGDDDVILRDVADDFLVFLDIPRDAVDLGCTTGVRQFPHENIHEGGFPGARGAHDTP